MPIRSHIVHTDILKLFCPNIPNFEGVIGLRRIFVFILPRRHRLRAVGVGFVVDKLITVQVFCQILRFPPSAVFYPYSTDIHSYLAYVGNCQQLTAFLNEITV
jgi:hypothetical protein